jgi:hypothetical protein
MSARMDRINAEHQEEMRRSREAVLAETKKQELKARHHAELELEKGKLALWREAELEVAKDKLQAESPDSAIIWTGTLADFGNCMNGLVKKRWIQATDQNDVLAQTCPHFIQKNGDPISPKSVTEMLRKKDKRKSGKA